MNKSNNLLIETSKRRRKHFPPPNVPTSHCVSLCTLKIKPPNCFRGAAPKPFFELLPDSLIHRRQAPASG
ncbi:unnamed protein product [Lactuca virosa]|uniref:Uncharacterized protein n=1 Tax=Lactuca virosa TaxID=75947 RepID=A0AAU9LGE0_9ASTR|nr:unnamed protein product [Lactuca virosa]